MEGGRVRNIACETWSLLIPFSKAEQSGSGRIARLSPEITRRVSAWLDAAHIMEGPLFRSLHQARPADTVLNVSSVRRLVKRAAKRAAVPFQVVRGLFGHSMRTGAVQDMMGAGFASFAIMQAGGCTNPHACSFAMSRTNRRGRCMSGGGRPWPLARSEASFLSMDGTHRWSQPRPKVTPAPQLRCVGRLAEMTTD
jgi:hypothetical protein